jgi:energy-coupling factor transporter ATP-binding protein EcfA2
MIEIRELTYRYPRASEPIFTDLNLEIPAGQFCAVLGANAAGKSTLCYTISGFVPHFYRGQFSGEVHVAGFDVPETPLARLAGTVGLVFSNPFNQITGAKFSVREEIAFGLENLGVPRPEMEQRIEQVMEVVGLSDLGDRSPYALSGGQQQRLAIASILVMEPQVLVLDEPTAQLDPDGARDVFEILRNLSRRRETTVVLATHRVEWVAVFADRAVVLQDGQIVADGVPLDILAAPELEEYGISPTRYTTVARRSGLQAVDGQIPVTLEQAISFFT